MAPDPARDPLPRTPVAELATSDRSRSPVGGLLLAVDLASVVGRGRARALRQLLALLFAGHRAAARLVSSSPPSRYTYGPAMVRHCTRGRPGRGASARHRQAGWRRRRGSLPSAPRLHAYAASWRDSATLWTRALAVDDDDDVARYNLALASIEAGRADDAVRELEALVARVPDHESGGGVSAPCSRTGRNGRPTRRRAPGG